MARLKKNYTDQEVLVMILESAALSEDFSFIQKELADPVACEVLAKLRGADQKRRMAVVRHALSEAELRLQEDGIPLTNTSNLRFVRMRDAQKASLQLSEVDRLMAAYSTPEAQETMAKSLLARRFYNRLVEVHRQQNRCSPL